MSWAEHHKQSESYANEADAALIGGEVEKAAKLYCLVAEAEVSALEVLDHSKVRTLGITAVSATALWYKAGDHQKFKQLAEKWLTHNSLPLFAVDQIQMLLEDCNEELKRLLVT